jgi:hypothetical protein
MAIDTSNIKPGDFDGSANNNNLSSDDLRATIQAIKDQFDGLPEDLTDLTDAEIAQLATINSVTISNTQWGYVGAQDQSLSTSDAVTFTTVNTGQGDNELYAMDQDVQTTDSVTFGGLTINGTVDLDGAVTINESGDDHDFRVKASGEANALFVRGSDGNVGIGTSSPVEKLDVGNGNISGLNNIIQESSRGQLLITGGGSGGSHNVVFEDSNNDTYAIFHQNDGIEFGNPTGGGQGSGTVNAKGIYDDGTQLTDYVFDKYLGSQSFEYTDEVRQRYDDLDATMFDPAVYANYWRTHHKLPGMPDLDDVIDGKVKVGHGNLIQRLMETVELQAIHIEHLRQQVEDRA